jgi:hypothetical protein
VDGNIKKDRDSGGKFVVGNKVSSIPSEIKELRKHSRKSYIKKLVAFGNMPEEQFKTFADNLDKLSRLERGIVNFWIGLSTSSKLEHLKYFSSYILGIPEVRAVAFSEIDSGFSEESEGTSELKELNKLELNKQEKLDLLEKYKKIVESE